MYRKNSTTTTTKQTPEQRAKDEQVERMIAAKKAELKARRDAAMRNGTWAEAV